MDQLRLNSLRTHSALNTLIGWAGLVAFSFCLLVGPVAGQKSDPKTTKAARKLGLDILSEIKAILKKEYYDPNFRGINLDQRFGAAEERIKTLESYPQVYRAIAQLVIDFKDSHTAFVPPTMTKTVDYGFSWQMIGDRCYVVDIKKGSDAEAKGLRPGDVITGIENYNPTRENLWLLTYLLYRLDPQSRLKIFLAGPSDSEREVLIQSKVMNTTDVIKEKEEREFQTNAKPYKCAELNLELLACKLYTFAVDINMIDKMMKEVKKHRKFILDLRGNGGGHVATEMRLTGYFFDHDVKIADERTRRKTEERIAKSQKEKSFSGDLIVLIDSKSASASEVFARVIQIEKRGRVIGDVSAGKVRQVYISCWKGKPVVLASLSAT